MEIFSAPKPVSFLNFLETPVAHTGHVTATVTQEGKSKKSGSINETLANLTRTLVIYP
jgi:hypothetical protein